MVDFHSHILPEIDDGARDVSESLDMVEESKAQGVDIIVATPHFYADEDDPISFVQRRQEAYNKLIAAMRYNSDEYPKIFLGSEILYFPGMSDCDELSLLKIEKSDVILIEPPMLPWSDFILDEIESVGRNLRCIPVIAHIDRYMQILGDYNLIDKLSGRKVLVQCNASFFMKPHMKAYAAEYISDSRVHLIGSDCHNMSNRAPNMLFAQQEAYSWGLKDEFDRLGKNARNILKT